MPKPAVKSAATTTTAQTTTTSVAKDQQKFDASLKQAQSIIEGLKPELQSVTAHLTGNSHIDAAWLWP